jgi:hypothetical protein
MLFKDTIKLKEFAQITGAVNFASVKLTIQNVENTHLVPVLGDTLYKSLNDAYTAASSESTLTAQQLALLDKCRYVIGPYVCYYYAPKADVALSDGGARRAETAQEKTAFQYQVTNFREANLRDAENATETLISFLETNKADYSDWTTSDAFKQYRSLFIKTGNEFQSLYPSATPYRNYMAMRFKMFDIEEQLIRDAITGDLYDYLKEKDADATYTFTDSEQKFSLRLKKAIAYLTVAYAVPHINVRIDSNGVTVTGGRGSTTNDATAKQETAPDNQLSWLVKNATESGQQWLKSALQYLADHAGDFSAYTPPAPPSTDAPVTDNSTYKTVFGLY